MLLSSFDQAGAVDFGFGDRAVSSFLTVSSARLRRAGSAYRAGPRAPLASSLRAPHPFGRPRHDEGGPSHARTAS